MKEQEAISSDAARLRSVCVLLGLGGLSPNGQGGEVVGSRPLGYEKPLGQPCWETVFREIMDRQEILVASCPFALKQFLQPFCRCDWNESTVQR